MTMVQLVTAQHACVHLTKIELQYLLLEYSNIVLHCLHNYTVASVDRVPLTYYALKVMD